MRIIEPVIQFALSHVKWKPWHRVVCQCTSMQYGATGKGICVMSDSKGSSDDAQIRTDNEHLKILSIIWYVMSALPLIGVCLGIVYILGGVGMAGAAGGGQDEKAVAGFAMCAGGAIIVMSLLGCLLNFFVARNLGKRKGHLYCIIIAGLTCLSFPLGTILGVFTIMVLLRPTVKQAFGVAS